MKKSLWVILILGALTFGLLLVGMHMTLTALQKSSAGERVKFANQIKKRFEFDSVTLFRRTDGEVRYLLVVYETDNPLAPNGPEEAQEIQAVGAYVFEQLSKEDKKETDQVRVERHEIRESGCDRNVRKAEGKVVNPEIDRLFRED